MRILLASIAILAIVGLVVVGAKWSSKPPYQQSNNQSTQQNTQTDNSENGIAESNWNAFWRKVWSEPINIFTLILAGSTTLLFVLGVIQIGFLIHTNRTAETAANAAIEQNKISRDAMIADQRPWLPLDVDLTTPLVFDHKAGDSGGLWQISLRWNTKNIGKTPATNVSFSARLIPWIFDSVPVDEKAQATGPIVPGTNIATEFDDVCGFTERLTDYKIGFGQIMFPNETNEKWTRDFGLNGDPHLFKVAKELHTYTGQFLIIACLTYGSTISDSKYRTAKAYSLWKIGDGKINLDGEAVPLAKLGFTVFPTNGTYAR